ncbi:hypothetical protein [Pseudooceanicola sp.]
MTRMHFLILATLALCVLPILGTLTESPAPRHTVQIPAEFQIRHF